jgi:4-hydroxybenzoate polyprenyltransferase
MVAAIALSYTLSFRLAAWTLTGLALSVFYSWQNGFLPRGKDIPVLDMLINSFGFGFCSVLFGYMMTDAPLRPEIFWAGAGFSFAYLGGMPTSQIFQLPAKKGSPHNYTSLFGAGTILKFGALFFLLHIIFLAFFHANFDALENTPATLGCWLGWLLLVLASSVHSLWWSRQPYVNSYNRMNRQMVMMMTSQLLWTIHAWILNS